MFKHSPLFPSGLLLALLLAHASQPLAAQQCGCSPVGNGAYLSASGLPNPYAGCLTVNGTFYIDQDWSFSGNLWMGGDARLEIVSQASLTLSGFVSGNCGGGPYDRILVGEDCGLFVQPNTHIENGKVAIEGKAGAFIDIQETYFSNFQQVVSCNGCEQLNILGGEMHGTYTGVTARNGSPASGVSIDGLNPAYCQMAGIAILDYHLSTTSKKVVNSRIFIADESGGTAHYGILVRKSSEGAALFEDTHIEYNAIYMNKANHGIHLQNAQSVFVSNNYLELTAGNQPLFQFNGIDIDNSAHCTVSDNYVATLSYSGQNNTIGIELANSPGCLVSFNYLHNTGYGVVVFGDCSSPDMFSSNVFNMPGQDGTMNVGLFLYGAAAKLGSQYCQDNEWHGTFSTSGAVNQGVISESIFLVKPSAPYMPPNPVPLFGWFQSHSSCPSERSALQGGDDLSSQGSKIQVFPNPSTGHSTVRFPNGCRLIVTDIAGQLVFSSQFQPDASEAELDLEAGIYFVQAFSNQHRCTEKLVVLQ